MSSRFFNLSLPVGIAVLFFGLVFATAPSSTIWAEDSAAPVAAATEMPSETPAPLEMLVIEEVASEVDPDSVATETDAGADAEVAVPVQPGLAGHTQVAPSVSARTNQSNTQSGSGVLVFWFTLFVLIVSMALARGLSTWWKLPDYQTAYTIVLFCFIGGLISTITGIAGNRMNLGIDLRGGSILVYDVTPNIADNATEAEKLAQEGKTISNIEMGELKTALARRINPSGVREISIQELGNNSEVKITIPEADEAEVARLERIINSSGQLKFRILASTDSPEEKELIDRAQGVEGRNAWDIHLDAPIGKDGIILGGTWIPVDPTQMDSVRRNDVVLRDSLLKDPASPAAPLVDVLILQLDELYDVTGRHMATIREGIGSRGDPEVNFSMNGEGAERLGRLTNRYKAGSGRSQGRQLGIVMNDFLYSAPNINDTISRSGVITFGNDLSADSRVRIQREVRDLIQVMNAGVLPAKLSDIPVTKMVTGPTLGADTIQKGKNSIIWGGLIVLLFMIAYYGFGGAVASFAVVTNLLLIMTFMLGLRAAFTLPGLAGLVLTVGMAVDANVLIFERIREELGNGATVRMAIRNGFQRAFSAIVDSNVTTMITAAILYMVGTDQIKGFAVTLFLGVAFSLFTATFVSRIIFETAEKIGLIGKNCVSPIIPGLKAFGRTNIDFMAKSRTAIAIATIFIAIGIIGVFARGKGIFDIDFVGGVEIQAIFTKEQNIANIRSKLNSLPDLSVSNLSLSQDRNGNPVPAHTCFTICTSCPPGKIADEYRTEVEQLLRTSFGDDLRHYQFSYSGKEGELAVVDGKITSEVSIDPPLSQEVIIGFLKDKLDILVTEKNVESFAIDATNPEYRSGDKDSPYSKWTVTLSTTDEPLAHELLDQVSALVNERQTFEASNTIGSSVAGYARTQGMLAILASLICIILYIWVRFTKVVYGLASVISLIYNVLITLGAIALSYWIAPYFGFIGINEFKIGLPTVAAFLTIIGYSLNDTIILFDRIREVRGKNLPLTAEIINRSINQTLSRTILTSLTTLFVALVLYFFGGAGIHTFAFAMSVGIIIGTLSTIFISSSYLLLLTQMDNKNQKRSAPRAATPMPTRKGS